MSNPRTFVCFLIAFSATCALGIWLGVRVGKWMQQVIRDWRSDGDD